MMRSNKQSLVPARPMLHPTSEECQQSNGKQRWTAVFACHTGLSQLAQYGSRDTGASDSSACKASSESPSASTREHSMPAGSDTPEQQQDKPSLRILGRRVGAGLTKIALKPPQTGAVEQEPTAYGPALAPEGYHDDKITAERSSPLAADVASDGAASDPPAGQAVAEAQEGAGPEALEAAGVAAAQDEAVAVVQEPAEPVVPGMEPEGPMPSSEMQLIITKLAGFIQVGFHKASATPCALASHLSLANPCGA